MSRLKADVRTHSHQQGGTGAFCAPVLLCAMARCPLLAAATVIHVSVCFCFFLLLIFIPLRHFFLAVCMVHFVTLHFCACCVCLVCVSCVLCVCLVCVCVCVLFRCLLLCVSHSSILRAIARIYAIPRKSMKATAGTNALSAAWKDCWLNVEGVMKMGGPVF